MKIGTLRNFGRTIHLLEYFPNETVEVHGKKDDNVYLCRKQHDAGYNYMANEGMMTDFWGFEIFTSLPREYYVKNHPDFLWVDGNYFKHIGEKIKTSNKSIKSVLLTMGG